MPLTRGAPVRSTVTVHRGDTDLTVVVSHGTNAPDRVVRVLDEEGTPVRLTPAERVEALERARAGLDECGR